jgi:hypothetical protein
MEWNGTEKGGTNEARIGEGDALAIVMMFRQCRTKAISTHLAILLLLLARRCYWSASIHGTVGVLCFLLRWL